MSGRSSEKRGYGVQSSPPSTELPPPPTSQQRVNSKQVIDGDLLMLAVLLSNSLSNELQCGFRWAFNEIRDQFSQYTDEINDYAIDKIYRNARYAIEVKRIGCEKRFKSE